MRNQFNQVVSLSFIFFHFSPTLPPCQNSIITVITSHSQQYIKLKQKRFVALNVINTIIVVKHRKNKYDLKLNDFFHFHFQIQNRNERAPMPGFVANSLRAQLILNVNYCEKSNYAINIHCFMANSAHTQKLQ